MQKYPLAVLIVCFFIAPKSAFAGLINYTTLGDFQTPTLNSGGVTIQGSADLDVQSGAFGGVGIAGGLFDHYTDNGESISFMFNSGPATNISAQISGILAPDWDGNGNSIGAEFTVEAFDAANASLGVLSFDDSDFGPLGNSLTFDLSNRYANAPISSFTFTVADGFATQNLSFDAAAVPEPSSLLLMAVGGTMLILRRRRFTHQESV